MAAVTPPAGGRFTARVTANRRLSAKAFELTLERPAAFVFSAGQRLQLEYEATARDYSIVSGPDEARLRLCIRQVAGGRLSGPLAAVRDGAAVTFTGPHGYFTFRASPRPAVFVATGTGIAPFCAMAAAGVGGFTLLHGVATPEELYYREFIQPRAAAFVACLSGGRPAGPARFSGRVTDYLRDRLPPAAYDFYLCGRQEMVRDATLLIDERFPESLVYSEIFY
jgi:benzoate/toluate 1,2-dioxygenase reductase component